MSISSPHSGALLRAATMWPSGNGDKYRCQVEAAEVMAAAAERLFAGQGERQGSAMQASHIMSNAIAQLHGVPAARARRTALRHWLIRNLPSLERKPLL